MLFAFLGYTSLTATQWMSAMNNQTTKELNLEYVRYDSHVRSRNLFMCRKHDFYGIGRKLEVGRFYRMANGKKVKIDSVGTVYRDDGVYTFFHGREYYAEEYNGTIGYYAVKFHCWHEYGEEKGDMGYSKLDIVEDITEQALTAEKLVDADKCNAL